MIIQTNTFICEICEHMESFSQEVDPHSDPVVGFPYGCEIKEYAYIQKGDKELLGCGSCQEKNTCIQP